MKKAISISLILLMLINILSACNSGSTANQQDKKTDSERSSETVVSDDSKDEVTNAGDALVLKYGHVSPETSEMHENSMLFAEKVKERTNGQIVIEVYPNAQLGGEETMLDSLFSGTMDMGLISANVVSTIIPEFNTIVLPFFFDSFEQVGKVINNEEFNEKTKEIVNDKGLHFLGVPLMAARGILNTKHAVHTPDDLKGLKIRVNTGAILTDTFDAMGVSTTQLAFGEVYTAMQQNVIDGLDNGIYASNLMKFTEVAKYYTNTMHYFQLSPLFVSDQTWSKLTDEQKQIMREECKNLEETIVNVANEYDAQAAEIAQNELGVEVVRLTSDEFDAFRERVQPVYDKYIPLIGEDYYNFVADLR